MGYCYRYDGTFPGFLCAVRDIYQYHEPPELFLLDRDPSPTLYEERWVTTRLGLAQRVYDRLHLRLGRKALLLVEEGFLTCPPDRELLLWRFIDFALTVGKGAEKRLDNYAVLELGKAVRHLQRECELLTGFVRFSDYGGLLAGEISPKNRVLPILKVHFCDRMAEESFLLFDRTHGEVLLHRPGETRIVPVQDFQPPPPGQEERTYRALWRRFYDTIAIEGRINPKLRQTHMPKRYWAHLTEFQEEDVTPLSPAPPPPTLEEEASAWPKTHTP